MSTATSDSVSSSSSRRSQLLRSRAHAFCTAFLESVPAAQILDKFFVPAATTAVPGEGPKITEHGPVWANERLPFVGRTFVGRRASSPLAPALPQPPQGHEEEEEELPLRRTCDDYFRLLAAVLEFEAGVDSFPGEEGFIVDVGAGGGGGAVSVVGKGGFRSLRTGRRWEERFIYRLSGFDAEGRIGHWEIWADPLSAWMAVGGGAEQE